MNRNPHREQMNQDAELPDCSSVSTLSKRRHLGQGGTGFISLSVNSLDTT